MPELGIMTGAGKSPCGSNEDKGFPNELILDDAGGPQASDWCASKRRGEMTREEGEAVSLQRQRLGQHIHQPRTAGATPKRPGERPGTDLTSKAP